MSCFIDYNKAVDKVRHDQLMYILKMKHLQGYRYLRIISSLFHNQKMTVCIIKQLLKDVEVTRGGKRICFSTNTLHCIL